MDSKKIFFYFLLTLAMVAWGHSWVIAKILSDYITAQELIFYRFSIATITFIPILLYMKLSFKIDIKTFFLACVASFFLVLYSIFYFDGTKHGTAGLGGAFVTTLTPILTFVILVLFFKHKFHKKDALALIIGAIGVMSILNIWTFNFNEIFVIANLLFILASFSWVGLTITNSKLNKKNPNKTIHPLVFTFYTYLIITIVGYIISPFESGNILEFDFAFYFNLIMLSVLGTAFATSIYFLAITKIGTNEASSFIFLVPFNAIFLSYFLLDEPIYFSTIIGTVLTIFAVFMINKNKA